MSLTYSGTQTGILQCMGGSVNLNSIISAVAPGGGGSVNSVGGATGTITLSSPGGSILFGNPSASSLTLQVDTSVIATKASVDTAQGDATQALTDAGSAQGDANKALADAGSAQTTANNAQTDAGTALATANQAVSDLATQLTANGVGAVGTSADTASLATSLWAYAKQAETDAQAGITSSGNANTNLANQLTANGVGAVGTSADTPALNTSLWAYAKQAETNAQAGISSAGTANSNLATQLTANGVGAVGTSADTASLATSLWAYAKQAEADAQTAITDAGNAQTDATQALTDAGTAQTDATQALTDLATLLTANAVGEVGTNTDTADGATSLWAYAKFVKASLPQYKQATLVNSPAVALTASWATYQTMSITTQNPSCSILVWCDADFTQTTGATANLSVRLTITPSGQATQTSDIRTIDIQNDHRQNISLTFSGTGFSTPGSVVINLQAIDNAGSSEINVSALMVIVNPTDL